MAGSENRVTACGRVSGVTGMKQENEREFYALE